MAEKTGIAWTDSTFNPWIGCTKVGPGCDNCYAEQRMDRRLKVVTWGAGQPRNATSPRNWSLPRKWQREAAAFEATHGRRQRVFCASLGDVFDNKVPDEWRSDLWALIAATPHLDWLLLTKRPQNIAKMLPRMASRPGMMWPWPNVWIGTTVENQDEANRRIPHLLAVPAVKRFLSCEPLLGPVDLREVWASMPSGGKSLYDTLQGSTRIDWVICGGESGPNTRPMHPDWARSLRDQCQAAGVPFFFKQMPKKAPIPEEFRIREFPLAGVV